MLFRSSIKTYLIEYPKKKSFPKGVYKASYQLVEYATSEFEENTKKIEELIRQRDANIALATKLKNILNAIVNKEANWKQTLKEASNDFSEDIIDTLGLIGRAKSKKSQNCQDAMKLINARIANLESNLHIEIDMERIEPMMQQKRRWRNGTPVTRKRQLLRHWLTSTPKTPPCPVDCTRM